MSALELTMMKRIGELKAENARWVMMVERLTAELSNISGWGRGLESDLSHARVEISFLKAEVERLRASSFVTAVPVEEYERLLKAGDALASALILFEMKSEEERQGKIKAWSAAKEGKPSV